MTYIKTTLPEISTLKVLYERDPEYFIHTYSKYEIIQGPEDSITFLSDILK